MTFKSRNLVADEIAAILTANGIKQVFGITGAGNIQLFDALARSGNFNLIFTHHEQSAVMAAATYFRTKGELALALVTTGGGSTNALTGLVGANMDSIPVLVLAGNEPSRYTTKENELRVWGIQGFDTVEVFSPVTKFAKRITDPALIGSVLREAITSAISGKPGVSWVEIPLDIQTKNALPIATIRKAAGIEKRPILDSEQVESVISALQSAERPVFWLGHGIRLSGAIDQVRELVGRCEIPFILSWAGADLIANDHQNYVGKAGVYGERAANLILQASDYVLAIGTRLAIPQIGYSLEELAPMARIDMVDIDNAEANKHGSRVSEAITADAKGFLDAIVRTVDSINQRPRLKWLSHVAEIKKRFPLIGPEHNDSSYMNSYRFVEKMQQSFSDDEIIVTDMGTGLLSGFYALKMKSAQRLMTSTGLGEMGFGLPGAIGASIAMPGKRIVCLNADGGMMLNLQELQTIVHHQLPIKIFIFNNDGYLMIKRSQTALLDGRFTGVNKASGVSCPDFSKLGDAFGIKNFKINVWEDFEEKMELTLESIGPAICEIKMDPIQAFLPRLQTAILPDGTLISPPLEDLTPFISINELEWALLRKADPRSYELRGLDYV